MAQMGVLGFGRLPGEALPINPAVGAGQLKHDRPAIPNQRNKEHWNRSSHTGIDHPTSMLQRFEFPVEASIITNFNLSYLS